MITGISLDGTQAVLRTELLKFATALRSDVIVTSAFRKGDSGEHGKGLAVDIVVPDYRGKLLDLYLFAERFGWTGIGVYPTWQANGEVVGGLHLDLRLGPPARWMGLGSGKSQQYVALNKEQLKKAGVI